jgi:RHS repeat-associated protein
VSVPSDQIGSTVALLNSSGAVAGTWVYDIYGKVAAATGSVSTPLRYGGGYTDAETGLIYLQARYYDPATGQFVTVDPIVASTLSAYAYLDGDPLNAIDPTGLCAWWGGLTQMAGCALKGAGSWISHNTIGLCAGASGSLGAYGSVTACAGFSGGHFFASLGPSGGLTTGIGGSAGLSLLLSNAHSPNDLKGGNPGIGGSVDLPTEIPLSASEDYQWSRSSSGRYVWQNQCGLGIGFWTMDGMLPAELHSSYGTSKVWTPFG